MRQAQQLLGGFMVEDAYPANADVFRARREPQVLNRQAGAEKVGQRLGRPSEDERCIAATIASHRQVQRRLQDSFQFETRIDLLSRTRFDALQLRRIGPLEKVLHAAAYL